MSKVSRRSHQAQVKPGTIMEANLEANDNDLMGALKANMMDVANGEPDDSKLTSKPASYKGNIQNKRSIDSSK